MRTHQLEVSGKGFAFVTVLIILSMLLAACGASKPSPNAGNSTNVDIILTEFSIQSSLNKFEAGKTYRFTIKNEGAIAHELVIAEPLTDDTAHSDMEEMHAGLILAVDETQLTPGATVTMDATFPDHVSDEGLEFACHTTGHYEAGMKIPITVE